MINLDIKGDLKKKEIAPFIGNNNTVNLRRVSNDYYELQA